MGSSFPAQNLPLYLPSVGGEGKLLNLGVQRESLPLVLFLLLIKNKSEQNKNKTKQNKQKNKQTKNQKKKQQQQQQQQQNKNNSKDIWQKLETSGLLCPWRH